MPVYEVTAPDGHKYRVETPEGATEQDAIAYVQRQLADGQLRNPSQNKPEAALIEDTVPGLLQDAAALTMWQLYILLVLGVLAIVASRFVLKAIQDGYKKVRPHLSSKLTGRLLFLLLATGAVLIFIFDKRGKEHPFNNPSAAYCNRLSQETYQEALNEALSDSQLWKLDGDKNAQAYAKRRTNTMLAIAKCR